jgi:anti-sigma regulatory factor (Ser/Thr protein kinase)
MNTTAAFAVGDGSQVAEARRAAHLLAARVGFSEEGCGQVALVVSELATNLAKHASRGEILLRALGGARAENERAGVEILSIDAGPGMPDFAASRRDGYSTTGTLGHGLGAIERQSHFFQVYTGTGGTVALARLWRDGPPTPADFPPLEVGVVHVSKPGEDIAGDEWSWRLRDDRLAVIVADGLGHGLSAYEAAAMAVRTFGGRHDDAPAAIVAAVHAALRASRGAAIAVLAVDLARGTARYSGLGNVSGAILNADGTRQSMVSQNGTAGHTAPRIQEFSYPVPSDSVLVLHSDGLGTHWDLAAHPGLRRRHPSIVAGVLYREASRRRDDVTIVVASPARR